MSLIDRVLNVQDRLTSEQSPKNNPGQQNGGWSTTSANSGMPGDENPVFPAITQEFSDDAQRKAMFAHMSGAGGGLGAPVGSPMGVARGTRAGRFVDAGGINAKGQVAKTTGIHVPSNRHPGKGGMGHAAKVPFNTQVANKLGLTPQQLSQMLHSVKGKSPQRLAAGAKLHTKLANHAASQGNKKLAAQHKAAAALHKQALAERKAAAKKQEQMKASEHRASKISSYRYKRAKF